LSNKKVFVVLKVLQVLPKAFGAYFRGVQKDAGSGRTK